MLRTGFDTWGANFMNGIAQRATRHVLFPIVVVVATLYLAREFLIPIALAVLISFLLAPVIARLERWHLGRIGSVLITTLLTFAVIGGVAYVVGEQLIELANDLPKYRTNLHEKIAALRAPKNSGIGHALEGLKDLTSEVTNQDGAGANAVASATPVGKPVPVMVVNTSGSAFDTLKTFAIPVIAPLGTAALVMLLVIFILLQREDMRDRLIHLIGHGHLQITTQALDEAASRVSRYLLAQLIVNVTYGIPIGIGLYFIGIPNAVLWGMLATILRFIPYIGPWLAAACPLVLSLVISPGWTTPIVTLGLYVVVELISNNVVEPWLYGSSTGMSPIAVIAAAAFWTWLWGGIGLLLATPLTVCIAVIGKYIPSLSFIDVLIGDKPPIAAEDRFYQRLLASDEDEICEIAEAYAEAHSLQEAFDNLIVPALRLADEDFHSGVLNEEERCRIMNLVLNLVTDLGEEPPAPAPSDGGARGEAEADVACIPAGDLADEVAAVMLSRLLLINGVRARVIPSKLLASEMVAAVGKTGAQQLCISAIPPGSTRQTVYVCKRLRESFPEARLSVGLWGEANGDNRRVQRVRRIQTDAFFTEMREAAKDLTSAAPVTKLPEAKTPAAA